MLLPAGWGQIADLPDVFVVGGTTGYSGFTTAYNACVAKSYNTCEVWDYNLTTAPEQFSLSPFNFGVATIPVYAHLGPGTITLLGPLVVPQNSVITGAGRSQSSIALGLFCRLARTSVESDMLRGQAGHQAAPEVAQCSSVE